MTTPLSTARVLFLLLILVSVFFPFLIQIVVVRVMGRYREKAYRQKGSISSIIIGLIPTGCLYLLWLSVIKDPKLSGIFWSGFYVLAVYLLFAYVYFHLPRFRWVHGGVGFCQKEFLRKG